MFKPRRLHPAAALIMGIRAVRLFVFPFVPLIVVAITKIGKRGWTGWLVWVAIALILFAAVWGVLSWRRFTYRVEDGELRIEHGVLIRNRRFIPQERIHSIDLVESVLHRLFGVVNVRVETAGGGEPEGLLVAVSRSAAEELRRVLTEKVDETEVASGKEDTSAVVRRLSTSDLLIAGATSGSIGIAFSLAGGALSFIDNLLPNIDLFAYLDRFIGFDQAATTIAMVAVIALIIAWLVAVMVTMLTYGRFQVSRLHGDLIIERGLLERRRSTIPLARIQAIRMVEGLLRQPFGLMSLHVESAGYGTEDGVSTVLFPLIRKKDVNTFLREMAPDYQGAGTVLRRLPRRAWRRSIVRASLPIIVIAGVVSLFFFPWGLASLTLFLPAALYGHFRYRDAGWCMHANQLMLRSRRLGRTTAIVTSRRIQSGGWTQSFFQRRQTLATIWVSVASGAQFRLADVDEQEGNDFLEWLRPRRRFLRSSTHDG